MKSNRTILLLAGLSLFFAAGIMIYSQMETIPVKMLIIYGLIGVVAVISIIVAYRKMKEEKQGQPLEDEFTNQIKFKIRILCLCRISLHVAIYLFIQRFVSGCRNYGRWRNPNFGFNRIYHKNRCKKTDS